MGVVFSHNAFSGSCRQFNEMRSYIAKAVGVVWPTPYQVLHGGEPEFPMSWNTLDWPGVTIFLKASDHEGRFSPLQCRAVAVELGLISRVGMPDDIMKRIDQFAHACEVAYIRTESLVWT